MCTTTGPIMASEITVDPFLVPSGSPPQPQHNQKKSWDEMRQAVRNTRKMLTSLASRVPTNFKFRTITNAQGELVTKLYFLGIGAGSRESSLLYVDITSAEMDSSPWPWKFVLDSFQATLASGELSKEEQLMRERQRLGTLGITSYDLHDQSGMLVFPACNSLFHCELPDVMVEESILPSNVLTSCSGARLDPKICPTDADLMGFINNNDIWVSNIQQGTELRLTYSHKGSVPLSEDPISSGVPSFVVQEEFDRYTGYWWQPIHRGEDVCRILYEEVDESEVEILHIYSPSADGVDDFRYPRAGTPNARCCLKLVEFEPVPSRVEGRSVQLPSSEALREKQLYEPLSSFFPWMEYLVRAGWTPDAKYVWVQVLSRSQCRLAVVLISPECFIPVPKDMEVGSFDSSVFPPLQVIYEDTSEVWVNVHDLIHFLPQEKELEISFIWGSEKSGYRHLYHVTSSLQQCASNSSEMDGHEGSLFQSTIREIPLTSGNWEVLPKQLWVDEDRKLVLFVGLKETPLETHLYAVSYLHPSEPVRLTEAGYSHIVTCNKECQLFVSVYSNVQSAPCSRVFRVDHATDGSIITQTLGTLLGEAAAEEDHRNPELFEYPSSVGHPAYGMLYRPHMCELGVQYPTVLFVYGGPQVQLVTNAFKGLKFLRLHTLASQGYAVVVLDGRGSSARGLHFESHIKNNLGVVELEDQVEGLLWIATQVDCIDLTRVAIHGWSYGGFLSLMALAHRPEIFKVAIVGAPVVMWSLYDTGYTERYLGTPQDNSEAYTQGSVLSHVEKFPDQENRMLIIHGLIDENVHFQHTSVLVNALVKACKPYQLQVYPNERHGIRNHESSEHYKTMVLSFLQQHL